MEAIKTSDHIPPFLPFERLQIVGNIFLINLFMQFFVEFVVLSFYNPLG